MAYATREDLYSYGLPRGLLANPGRLVEGVSPASDVLELDGHGFGESGSRTPVLFRAEEGGELPTGLTAGTTYYAETLTDATFQVYAASSGGTAVNMTSEGSQFLVATALPIAAQLERYSRFVDSHLPAHVVPLEEPYPVEIVAIVAELAAMRLLVMSGQRSVNMTELEKNAHCQIARWAKAVPLRDSSVTAAANVAVVRSVTLSDRGWGASEDTLP